ncbi:MAG: hypothetical protein ACM3OO_13245 [Planctomycetaceae bacterium]
MAFVLRFVQEYAASERDTFMDLEARFAEMERRREGWPVGRRLQPYAGALPTHTLIWEHGFPSLAAAEEALALIARDPEHAELFRRQAPTITSARTEIYETLEL